MITITSRSNPAILDTVKLKNRKYREQTGRFYFEGIKLFKEAVLAGVELCSIFITERLNKSLSSGFLFDLVTSPSANFTNGASDAAYAVYLVSDSVYQKISDEKSPQGILCVAKSIDKSHKYNKIYSNDKSSAAILALSSVRDPGNLGAVVRSAAAFGMSELIISEDCADIYNPKTLRASMGAIFRMNITVCSDFKSSILALISTGFTVLAAMPDRNAKSVLDINFDNGVCFVVGNEGHGIDRDIADACTGSVFVPITDGAESLNASTAAAILMWEYFRKKSHQIK